MELEELSEIETQSFVLLCWKCYEQGEYNIPLFELNEFNEIEYKCVKRHIISKKDISYQPLNEKIKEKLTVCNNKEHYDQGQPSVFCAFCEICEKNICNFCRMEDKNRGHDCIVYKEIMETIMENNNRD